MTARADNLVIFGATGDLAQRMLLPSLYFLERDGLLPADLGIVGAARSPLDNDRFRARARTSVSERTDALEEAVWDKFARRLSYCKVDAANPADFAALAKMLGRSNVYYLSLSPDFFAAACANLESSGLATPESRIVIEKPIGHDLESSRAINACLLRGFAEKNIFRIDHYLGKETVQNLLALRFANTLFDPLWNRAAIDHVQIAVAEEVGVEGRAGYYDEYGALRDMVQNHILQLLCLVAMEPPARLDPDAVRDEKVKVLRSLRPIRRRDAAAKTVRGQYVGYAAEAGHESGTETFVALEAEIENWRWSGVPFYLRTGKRLARRRTEIVIQFLPVPHSVFTGDGAKDLIPNRLTITLQPEERVSLLLMNKTPGLTADGMRTSPLSLNLSLTDAFGKQRRRIAYEQLLLDAFAGNATLFVRGDEAEAAWSWIDGIEQSWAEAGISPELYEPGTNGPDGADALIARRGYNWAF